MAGDVGVYIILGIVILLAITFVRAMTRTSGRKKELEAFSSRNGLGNVTDAGLFNFFNKPSPFVSGTFEGWPLEAGYFTRGSGKHNKTYFYCSIAMRSTEFTLSIRKQGMLDGLGASIGLVQDIAIGEPEFDEAYVISTNNEAAARGMLRKQETLEAARELFAKYGAKTVRVENGTVRLEREIYWPGSNSVSAADIQEIANSLTVLADEAENA